MDWIIRTLRARRLDSVAIAYAVVSWIVVQAASIVLPVFDAPAWAQRALIIFLVMGFPLALVIAWFAVPHIESRMHHRGLLARSFTALALFIIVIVFVAGDFAYLLSRPADGTLKSAAITAMAPAKNSIAVLPFANMSGDPAKDYFSDGISEELLNDLANTPALRVAARTSSFAFKGKNENVAKIGQILGVRSILEGSVRAYGSHLRITATLINAADGYTLWSKTYDRDLTDVLIVQGQIAQAITSALTQKLLPVEKKPHTPNPRTINPEAYRMYLLGKHELAPRTQDGSEAALILFQKVTKLAPDFAEGFAELARAQMNLAEYNLDRSDLIPSARVALSRALVLDPRNIDALSAHLDLSLRELDWQAAINDAHQMQAISPNSAAVQHELFRFYLFLDFPDQALDAARAAVALDPLSVVDHLNIAAGLLHQGRYAETQIAAQAALNLEPDQPYVLAILCSAAAHSADFAAAQSAKAKLVAAGADTDLHLCQFQIAAAQGRRTAARANMDYIEQIFSKGGVSAVQLGENYAILGDYPRAVHWLTRAYDLKELWLFLLPGEKVVPQAFLQDKGWKALYQRPLFDSWRKAHDRIQAELAAHN